MAEKKPRILLIDDQPEVLPSYAATLEARGFEVVQKQYTGPADIYEIFQAALKPANRIDAVLTDLMWKGMPYGGQVASGLKDMGFNGPVAVHSSEPKPEFAAALKNMGTIGLFKKGEWDVIDTALKEALAAKGKERGA